MSKSISDLHIQIQPLFNRLLVKMTLLGTPCRVAFTHRSPEEQMEIWKTGRQLLPNGKWVITGKIVTKAMPWESDHQWRTAADIVPVCVMRYRDWDPKNPAWTLLHKTAKEFGLSAPIPWDKPHIVFQKNGETFRNWLVYKDTGLPLDYFSNDVLQYV